MSATTDKENAGFVGPGLIGEVAAHLGSNLSLSPYCLLPACFAAVAASLGKAARLRTPVWPGSLSPALHVAFGDADGRLSKALDFIVQPLRELQNERFAEETESTRRWIQERIKRLEGFHEQWTIDLLDDPSSESRPAQIAKLRRRLKPVMLIENPAPGQLIKAISNCADGSLLATFDDQSLSRLLDKATKSTNDFRLLQHGWQGRSFEMPGSRGACAYPVIEPCISCLIVCHPDTLGRLLRSVEPPVEQFCRQLVRLSTCEQSRETPVHAGQTVELLWRWQELITRLISLRRSGAAYRIELSSSAEGLVMQNWREHIRQRSVLSSQPKQHSPDVPVLAAKFGLCSRLVESHGDPGVSGAAMDNSIRLAEWCSTYGAGLSEMTATKSRPTHFESAADKMLKRIREHGRIIPRDLYRTYDCQRKELHDPVLEHLIKTGQARCVDGFVEAAETEPINEGTLRPKDSGAESG